jgi:hypothetical protein
MAAYSFMLPSDSFITSSTWILSWECEKCGMPNFATTFFNSTIETSNSFLTLDDEEGIQDSIGKPSHQVFIW